MFANQHRILTTTHTTNNRAVVTFPVWYVYYNSLHLHGLPMLHARMCWMAAMSGILMFMFVNVIMGGNPPKGYEKLRPKAA